MNIEIAVIKIDKHLKSVESLFPRVPADPRKVNEIAKNS